MWYLWDEWKRLMGQLHLLWLFRCPGLFCLLLLNHPGVITVHLGTRSSGLGERKRNDRERGLSSKWSCTLHPLSFSAQEKLKNATSTKVAICPLKNWWGNFLTKIRERMKFRGHYALFVSVSWSAEGRGPPMFSLTPALS